MHHVFTNTCIHFHLQWEKLFYIMMYVATMLAVTVSHTKTLKTIEQKFRTPSHTHIECDSSHTAIENTAKKSSFLIHYPHGWHQTVESSG